jgi:hypothetical protein
MVNSPVTYWQEARKRKVPDSTVSIKGMLNGLQTSHWTLPLMVPPRLNGVTMGAMSLICVYSQDIY